jgi:hypothetical protein
VGTVTEESCDHFATRYWALNKSNDYSASRDWALKEVTIFSLLVTDPEKNYD